MTGVIHHVNDLASIYPEVLLTVAGVVLLLLDAFFKGFRRAATPLAALAVLFAGWLIYLTPYGTSFGGILESRPITHAIGEVILISALIALLASQGYLKRERLLSGEYPALILWCVVGLLLMSRATELLTIFLALELLSVCLYALAAYHRRIALSTEAGLKYFLMGAFVSAFILYGIALLYGVTGSTRLADLKTALGTSGGSHGLVALAVVLLVAGFGFKMSIVPFHAWSPDTYQGAPSPFVAFLSVAPKAASAVVLIRVLDLVLGSGAMGGRWSELVALLSVLSMVGGNLMALVQRDIKRMLAYSGIAHMGYLLIPLVTLDASSWRPVIVYLLAYAFMNAGAFAVVAMLYARPGEQHLISDLSGWGYRYPFLGVCLAILMLSLGGIPPTLGFFGKYLVFLHAVSHGNTWLAVVGVATSLIGVFYYLRVVYALYMKEETREPSGLLIDGWGRLAALLAVAGTLIIGLWPARFVAWLLTSIPGLPGH